MTRDQIIRAWKSADYRSTLTPAERAALPESPAGTITPISDADLGEVGGARTEFIYVISWGCCDGLTGEVACGPNITDSRTCGYVCSKTGLM
ncbi:MAG TPA: mersacidin/lichenicidin family type 2 lantibiotic [Thermoanaerobaculia bacterium]|jgi:mersacidin/lichenicidin family type 2 lantibiotic